MPGSVPSMPTGRHALAEHRQRYPALRFKDKVEKVEDAIVLGLFLDSIAGEIEEFMAEALPEIIDKDKAIDALTDIIYDYLAGGNCFPAGTPVLTSRGMVAIESLERGGIVATWDAARNRMTVSIVTTAFVREHAGELLNLKLAGTAMESTPWHPFWVVAGKELFARPPPSHCLAAEPESRIPGRWVDAGDLRVGDEVILATGRTAVVEMLGRRPFCGDGPQPGGGGHPQLLRRPGRRLGPQQHPLR